MYAATRWAAERARKGHGATLIELVTYRVAAHSTSDDPSRYRPRDEAEQWPLGCPLERLRQHLCVLGEWDDTRHAALVAELEQQVNTAWKTACTFGTMNEGPKLDPGLMFEDVYETLPPHLARQREALRAELAGATVAAVAGNNEHTGQAGHTAKGA